jgi:hypothetical protein
MLATNINAPLAGYGSYKGMGAPAGIFGGGYGDMGAPVGVLEGGMAGMASMGSMASMGGIGLGGFGGVYRGISAPIGSIGGI